MMVLPQIDRHAELRKKNNEIKTLQLSKNSRYLLWHDNKILIAKNQDHYFTFDQLKCYSDILIQAIYLGAHHEYTYFTYHVDNWHSNFEQYELVTLRAAGRLINDYHLSLLFYSQGLINWHKSHQHCTICGQLTLTSNAGHSRVCSTQNCHKEHFPRIEPAVIFSVANNISQQSRLLLARQATWDSHQYSVLAGFVEHGESLEHAVARESQEEVGITLDNIQYVALQPWPFPSSLMLAFECSTHQININLIDEELETAKWFTTTTIENELKTGQLKLPDVFSISWHLIDRWYQHQTNRSLKSLSLLNSAKNKCFLN